MYILLISLGIIFNRWYALAVFLRISGAEHFCESPFYFNRKLAISVVTLVFVFPILLVKRVDCLKYPSLLSVGSMIYLMIAVVIKYFMDGDEKHKTVELNYRPHAWYDAFNAFPTILFGYQVNYDSTYRHLHK